MFGLGVTLVAVYLFKGQNLKLYPKNDFKHCCSFWEVYSFAEARPVCIGVVEVTSVVCLGPNNRVSLYLNVVLAQLCVFCHSSTWPVNVLGGHIVCLHKDECTSVMVRGSKREVGPGLSGVSCLQCMSEQQDSETLSAVPNEIPVPS